MLNKHYKKFRNSKWIAKFSRAVGAKNLWAFNQKSINYGVALGVACAWIPLPFHTTIAIFLGIVIDCNIFMIITSIWFANPITMPLMYYSAYQLGIRLLPETRHALEFKFKFSFATLVQDLHIIWKPLLLGCAILGVIWGLLAYLILQFAWPSIDKKIKHDQKNNPR